MLAWIRQLWSTKPAGTFTQPHDLAQAHECERSHPTPPTTSSARCATRQTVVYARLGPELAQLARDEQIACEAWEGSRPTAAALRRSTKQRRLRLQRFAKRFTQMSVRDARLLWAVHRSSLRAIAADNAGQLHRDVERFLLSSRGQRSFSGKTAPTIEKIRRWVREARQITRSRLIDPVG